MSTLRAVLRVLARPWLTAVDAALVFAVLARSHGTLPYVAAAALAAALAGVRLGWAALPVWLGYALQGLAVYAIAHERSGAAGYQLATAPLVVGAGAGAVVGARLLDRQRRRARARVAAAERTAAGRERERLARELHDSVSKTLHGMSLAAHALHGRPELAHRLAGAISEAAATADRETREILEGLRLDRPAEDLGVAVERLCRAWSARTGIPAACAVDPGELPVAVRYELLRIAHEALTNIARHAGATRAFVAVARRTGAATLTVRDDGGGFAVPADLALLQDHGHLGLVGMAERARTVGGRLHVLSEPGRGTTIRVDVPLDGRPPEP
ncbi:hypothetical protein Dvina_23355 [Dactylosporangium vinaceum]|uniref:histidine kinase n=1 Tax=Dactylosporangium vinaceum TaxID=53362 RepID=A0ABV5MCV7_9ACTN|nr:ATP-binding protein [Dactylosporangium vinaceum]UAC00727.1 hypothetical protein Dvina_23355 [Dactylosporangium vinaceum]